MKGALKYLLFFRNVVFLKWLSQIVFLVGLEQGLRNILKDKNSTKAEKQEAKDALKNLKEK